MPNHINKGKVPSEKTTLTSVGFPRVQDRSRTASARALSNGVGHSAAPAPGRLVLLTCVEKREFAALPHSWRFLFMFPSHCSSSLPGWHSQLLDFSPLLIEMHRAVQFHSALWPTPLLPSLAHLPA